MERREQLRPLFESLTVRDFPASPLGSVATLPSNASIRAAMEMLHARGILSVLR
jgi:hypothetical protein